MTWISKEFAGFHVRRQEDEIWILDGQLLLVKSGTSVLKIYHEFSHYPSKEDFNRSNNHDSTV